MQRLPENFSVLDNRLELPAPHQSLLIEGDEIVRSVQKCSGQVNPLVAGSSPAGPTISILDNFYATSGTILGPFRT